MSSHQDDRHRYYNPFDAVTQEYEKEMNKRYATKIVVEVLLGLFLTVFVYIVVKIAGINKYAETMSFLTFLGSYWRFRCWYSPGHPFTS